MAKYTYDTDAAEDAALVRCLADQQAAAVRTEEEEEAGLGTEAPKDVVELFDALVKDRLLGLVKLYEGRDADLDMRAIEEVYKADPDGVKAKLAAELAAARAAKEAAAEPAEPEVVTP